MSSGQAGRGTASVWRDLTTSCNVWLDWIDPGQEKHSYKDIHGATGATGMWPGHWMTLRTHCSCSSVRKQMCGYPRSWRHMLKYLGVKGRNSYNFPSNATVKSMYRVCAQIYIHTQSEKDRRKMLTTVEARRRVSGYSWIILSTLCLKMITIKSLGKYSVKQIHTKIKPKRYWNQSQFEGLPLAEQFEHKNYDYNRWNINM